MATIARNKKAFHDYHIEDRIEAGLVLVGTEVKSIRKGNVNLKDSHVRIKNGDAVVLNMHIAPYEQGNINNHDATRPRKLLLHKKEMLKLEDTIKQQGLTLVPLEIYINKRGLVKLQIGLAKGKKLHDKRQDLKDKAQKREIDRALKHKR